MPKVSVIIPVYNVEKYLRKCLGSVVNQTLNDIEIICVNNGSTDNSLQILEEYAAKDNRIIILDLQPNQGLSVARNKGLEIAKSEYIGFVDADDWIEPETYELALKAINDNNPDIVCWGAKVVADNGFYDYKRMNVQKKYHTLKLEGFKVFCPELYDYVSVTVWNKLFKAKIIKDNNILYPKGLNNEDDEFTMKYLLHCNSVFFINKYLYNYLQREFSTLYTYNECPHLLNIYKNIYDHYNQYNAVAKNKLLLQEKFFYYIQTAYTRSEDKAKIISEIKKLADSIDNSLLNDYNVALIQNNKISELSFIKQLSFREKLFSIQTEHIGRIKRIIISILGIKFKFKVNFCFKTNCLNGGDQ